MRVLGIDPGSYHCGYAVLDSNGGKPAWLECGTIDLPKKDALPVRLKTIGDDIADLITQYSPDAIACEDIYSGPYPRSGLVLSHVRGVIMYISQSKNIPITIYPAKTVKLAIGGSGNTKKEALRAMACKILGITTMPNLDASDALSVALCHIFSRR